VQRCATRSAEREVAIATEAAGDMMDWMGPRIIGSNAPALSIAVSNAAQPESRDSAGLDVPVAQQWKRLFLLFRYVLFIPHSAYHPLWE